MTADEIKVPYSPGPNAFDITPAGDGGVLKEIIKQGEGEYTPNSGCKVYVHYTGTLTDGTVFDSSRDRGEPFEFNLGKGQVIKGWDIGVATMKRKEVAMLTCRSDYAYGKSSGSPKIPPDSTLHFEVEMIDWQKEDLSPKKDGGILRNILQPGEGHATPNDGSMVDVHLICEYNGKVVEERDVTFNLGEGIESGIPQGVEKALEKFKLKEKSQLEIKSKYAWGKEGRPDLQIPPNSDLIYTITLNNFEKLKETWALDSDGKLEQGKFFKEKGTNYFKLNKLKLALKMYKKAIEYLEFDSGFVEEGEKERKALLISNHLNCALCLIKLQEFTEAKEQCNKALELEPTSEKGLFRRGQANLFLGEPEIAKVDFETVLKQDPNNKAAAQHVMVCNQKMKEQKAKEKQIYANMFEKFAQKDREEKDCRFGWWTGKSVEVEKMEENLEEIQNEKELKLKEHREFIKQMKERKERLEQELKYKKLDTQDEKTEVANGDNEENKSEVDNKTEKEGGGGAQEAARRDEDAGGVGTGRA